MTNQTLNSQPSTEYLERVANIELDAVNIARIVKQFWKQLPEDMPPETRSQITVLWYSSEFLEISNG